MNADPRLGGSRRAASAKPVKSVVKPKKPEVKPTVSPLELLLALEGDVRSIASYDALGYFMCNETRKLVRCGQIMFFRPGYRANKWQLQAASSVSSVDRNAPAVRAIEKDISSFEETKNTIGFRLNKATNDAGLEFENGLLLPLAAADGQRLGLLLFLRNEEFTPNEEVLLTRVSGAYGHAFSFFTKAKRKAKLARRLKLGIASAVLLAGFAILCRCR